MSVLQQFKCPCCDGAIEFDSRTQNMKCPYCDSEFELETLQAYDEAVNAEPQEDMTWESDPGSQWDDRETEGLRTYCCQTCGGEIVADETTGATACPFCGNPVVMTGQFAGDLRPDLVIPFKYDKKAAIAALENHYKGKPLLPRVFKAENHIKEVEGLYVPVWLFDADADADMRYKATRLRHWSDSHYNYTETSHFLVTRRGNIGFQNVPVDGSTKMEDALMESIEPFDLSDAVDFQTAYLSGYLADKYDVDSKASESRANARIKQSTQEAFAATVLGYSSVIPMNSNIGLHNSRARYALYPVWILSTQWNGQNFTFIMNGQTGKMAGNLPMDKGAFWRWMLGITGSVSAAVMAISYLLWLL